MKFRKTNKSSYANRGSALEDLVTIACNQYYNNRVARIDKVPVPVKILSVKSELKENKKQLTVTGFLESKSTVDYHGATKGYIHIYFDAKETKEENLFPLKNVKQHQVDYMRDMTTFGGMAFLIIGFSKHNRYFRMDYQYLQKVWDNWRFNPSTKGYASVSLRDIELNCHEIKPSYTYALNFLDGLVS